MRLVIEGNISSGKSTLIKYIKRKVREDDLCINDSGQIYFKKESRYNLLKLTSSDPLKWTFLLQLNFLLFLKTREKEDTKKFTITSRSSFSVMNIFSKAYLEQGYISIEEYEYLRNINNLYKQEACDVLVFISSSNSSERCSESIMKDKIFLYAKYYDKKSFIESVIFEKFTKRIIILNGDSSLDELELESGSDTTSDKDIPCTTISGITIYEAKTYQDVLRLLNIIIDP